MQVLVRQQMTPPQIKVKILKLDKKKTFVLLNKNKVKNNNNIIIYGFYIALYSNLV